MLVARHQRSGEGVEVVRLPNNRRVWAASSGLKAVAAEIEAIHLHQPLPALAVLLSRKFRLIPRLYFFHSPWGEEYEIRRQFDEPPKRLTPLQTWLRARMERFMVTRSERLVVFSQFMENRLKQVHAVPDRKIIRTNGAVDTDRFRTSVSVTEARRQLGWPIDRAVLLSIRNLEPRMGLENLIQALEKLTEPDCHLYIAGRGTLREALESQVFRSGLTSRVSFLGLVPDDELPLMYQAADMFVLPTRELEGFGLVTVEALACGCPVLATPVGATPEILEPIDPDWISTGTSADEIAAVVNRFFERREQWSELRKKCSILAQERYSWQSVVDEIERLTSEVIGLA